MKKRWWIAERRCTCVKTILVSAASKKEAQGKIDAGLGEGIDVHYYDIKRARVIREDKPPTDK